MISASLYRLCLIAALLLPSSPALATAAKIDAYRCKELRLEQAKFIENGILADLARGPEWGKSNLAPEKLREIELYIMLDEQLKFGCRDAKISQDAARAGRAAIELDIPTVPPIEVDETVKPPGQQIITIEPDGTAPSAPKPKKKPKPAGDPATGATPRPQSQKTPGGAALSGDNFLFP